MNIANYLLRHNVVYNNRIEDKKQSALFGTGKIGVCIWNENEYLCLQISNVDASPQGQMSSGIVKIKSNLVGECHSSLYLYNGVYKIDFENVSFSFYGGGGEEIFYIQVEDKRDNIYSEISLELWDTSVITNSTFRWERMVKNPNDWKSPKFFSNDDMISLSRFSTSKYGEQGVDVYEDIQDETMFGYSLGVKVFNIDYKIENDIISYYSKGDYVIAISNPSRIIEKNSNDTLIKSLKQYDNDLIKRNQHFWNDYFEKSYIVMHNDDSDYIENIYYVSKYILACGMLGNTPMHFITGNFRNEGDGGITWSVAYWWYNQRCLYSGTFAIGFPNFIKTILDMYFNQMEKMLIDTRKKYPNSEGMVVAETLCFDGRRSFVENSPGAVVAEFINCTGLEIALKMYEYYEYTNDSDYLINRFVPFTKNCLDFQISYELKLNEDGKYEIPEGIANSRESYVKIKNPITELGALRAVLPKFIDAYKGLGDTSKYENVLNNLIDFSFGGYPKRFIMGENGFDYIRTNWDDPCMELVYPFNLLGEGKPFYNEIVNNFENRIGRDQLLKCLTWDNSHIWSARLGLSDSCYSNIKWQIAKSQLFNNGIGTDGNCKYEFTGNIISAINESLMQSYDGIIRVFPAVDKNNITNISAFKLFAKNGFIVESEYDYKNFEAKFVKITALRNSNLKIFNPYGEDREAQITIGNKNYIDLNKIISCKLNKGEICIITLKNKEYELNTYDEKNNVNKKIFNYNNMNVQLGN